MRDVVLIVDDEPEIRDLLRAGLTSDGYDVLEAESGSEAQAKLDERTISLITLDLNLGGEDGLRLAREFRAKRNTPIIMISGKGDPVDRIVGLELGADDYIAKPFVMREVLARVRAVMRRYTQNEAAALPAPQREGVRYEFDGYVLDLDRRELTMPTGGQCELTTAEFNLLALLVKRPSRVLSRDELMDLLKGQDWSPLDRSIDGLVARLRRKIEPDSERPRLLKTVRGVGYAFSAAVRKL